VSYRKAIARFGPRPPHPGQLREILREIAHWAVASSMAIGAGCSATTRPNLGQDVPGAAGSAAVAGGAGSASAPGSMAGVGGVSTGMPDDAGAGAPTPTTPGDPEPAPGGAGRGADPTPPDLPTEWTSLPCGEAGLFDLTSGLAPEPPADYLGLFVRVGQDANGAPAVDTYSETGSPCSGATAGSDCLASFEDLRLNDPSCDPATTTTRCTTFLMATRGDEATRAAGTSAIRAALGAIDTATEAGLLAFLDGGAPINCQTGVNGPTEVRAEPDGFGVRFDSMQCGSGLFTFTLHVAEDGAVTTVSKEVIGPALCMTGRRPEGLRPAAAPQCAASRLGAYFSAAAQLEAASVIAFERLARELERHGAPAELVDDARRSALDEIRHTRSMAALSARFGGVARPPSIEPAHERPRFAMALENAVEGCVRETYGALVAHHQALAAHDPEVRAALTVIAEDESRHAELSWRIARWLEPTLGEGEQAALHAARAAALAELVATRDPGLSASELRTLGMPSAEVALALLRQLGAALGVA